MTENPEDPRLIDTRTPGEAAHAAPEDPAEEPANDGRLVVEEPAPGSPRPEPVINAAKLGGLVAACVVAVGGVVSLIVAGRYGDLNALGVSVGAAVTAVATLIAYLSPLWQARKARDQVTPLADPRNALGQRLIAIPRPTARDR